jgi:beta-lactamase regulating signal transducer with metallopeptidase domain
MTTSLLQTFAELTLATSLGAVVVALLRLPLRRVAGVRIAYWLWLLIPISALAALLPPLPSALAGANVVPATLRGATDVETYSRQIAHAAADYSVLCASIWLVGCMLMLALVARGQRTFIKAVADAERIAGNVYRSRFLRGPLLIGLLRPKIVLPIDFESKYSPQDRALILAHEQAHLRRGDIWTRAFATLCVCLFWFNPLMHWAAARLRFDQELACDATVLARSRVGRRRYATALLRTHLAGEPPLRPLAACGWHSRHPLKERIAMLRRPLPTLTRRVSGALATGAVILLGGCAVWSARPERVEAAREESSVNADRVVIDNGETLLSGDVVITLASDTVQVTSSGSGIPSLRAEEGRYVFEAQEEFRLADDQFVITAAGGRVEKTGTIVVLTTQSARISPTAPIKAD